MQDHMKISVQRRRDIPVEEHLSEALSDDIQPLTGDCCLRQIASEADFPSLKPVRSPRRQQQASTSELVLTYESSEESDELEIASDVCLGIVARERQR